MTTTPEDRQVLREWRDRHTNVRPARHGEKCVHAVWVGDRHAGDCGRTAQWVVDYSFRVKSLGRRPHCEEHTVSVIGKWAAFERGEVPA